MNSSVICSRCRPGRTHVRAASSYANNWGNNLRVEIPETGISIGELARFLREWLGHETHVSGAVIRSATGVTITASAGSDAFPALTGAESDLDGLVQDMAEAIHLRTQPYRLCHLFYTPAPAGLMMRKRRCWPLPQTGRRKTATGPTTA